MRRIGSPPPPKKGRCLSLLIFNTQLDYVVDGLRAGTCNIEHLSSGVLLLRSSVRCPLDSSFVASSISCSTMGLCKRAMNDSNVNRMLWVKALCMVMHSGGRPWGGLCSGCINKILLVQMVNAILYCDNITLHQ